MSFAITRARFYGINSEGPSYVRGVQVLELDISAAATDVDMDIGDDTPGTFWTAAVANAATGAMASTILARLQALDDYATFLSVASKQLADRIPKASAPGAGEYTLALENERPNLTFSAADGETAWKLVITWTLPDAQQPIVANYGPVS